MILVFELEYSHFHCAIFPFLAHCVVWWAKREDFLFLRRKKLGVYKIITGWMRSEEGNQGNEESGNRKLELPYSCLCRYVVSNHCHEYFWINSRTKNNSKLANNNNNASNNKDQRFENTLKLNGTWLKSASVCPCRLPKWAIIGYLST